MIGRHSPRFHRIVTSVSCLQAVQTNFSITEGTTLLASGTATPPAITFSGTRTGRPYPIWVKCNTTGGARGTWTGDVYYDGTGTVSEQSFTSAATVDLTGKGAGLTLNIPVANAATDNVWKATVGTWGDISGAGKDYTQATEANQPVLTTGLNGFPGIAFDGSNDFLASSLNLPQAGTTPTFVWFVGRTLTWSSGKSWFGGTVSASTHVVAHMVTSTPTLQQFNGSNTNPNSGAAVNSWVRGEAWFNNATSDYTKFGSTTVTGASAGNIAAANGRQIGGRASANNANCEILAVMYFSGLPTSGELAGLSAAATALYGSSVGV